MKSLALVSCIICISISSLANKETCSKHATDLYSTIVFLVNQKTMTYDQFKKTVQAKSISNKISVKNQEKYTKEVYKDSLNIINAPGFNINNLKSEIPVIEDNCIN